MRDALTVITFAILCNFIALKCKGILAILESLVKTAGGTLSIPGPDFKIAAKLRIGCILGNPSSKWAFDLNLTCI